MVAEKEAIVKQFGDTKVCKHIIRVAKNKRIAIIYNSLIQLQEFASTKFEVCKYSEDEIKKRHLGKMKCFIKFDSDPQLKDILTDYFANH